MMRLVLPLMFMVAVVGDSAAIADTQDATCQSDVLTPSAALDRLEWARNCALMFNVLGADAWVPSTTTLDIDAMPQPAKEYVEVDHSRSYTGNANGYKVNFDYSRSRYASTVAFKMVAEQVCWNRCHGGPSHWRWSPTPITPARSFPQYPVYDGLAPDGSRVRVYPTLNSDCSVTANRTAVWSGPFTVSAYCDSRGNGLVDEDFAYTNRLLQLQFIPDDVIPR